MYLLLFIIYLFGGGLKKIGDCNFVDSSNSVEKNTTMIYHWAVYNQVMRIRLNISQLSWNAMHFKLWQCPLIVIILFVYSFVYSFCIFVRNGTNVHLFTDTESFSVVSKTRSSFNWNLKLFLQNTENLHFVLKHHNMHEPILILTNHFDSHCISELPKQARVEPDRVRNFVCFQMYTTWLVIQLARSI